MKKSRVLVADGSPQMRRFMDFTLKRFLDVDVDLAATGESALEMLASSSYDLVVCDLLMPGNDSYMIIRKAKRSSVKEVPVIALTSSTFDDEAVECLRLGADTVLKKPVDLYKLMTKARRLLGSEDGRWPG